MAWIDEVCGSRIVVHSNRDGACAIGRRDAGRDAVTGLDGDREGGAELGGVLLHHHGDFELFEALFRQGQTDEATTMLGHKVDGLGRSKLGSNDEVAFVLSALVVDEDDEVALAKGFEDLGDGCERHQGSFTRSGIHCL